VVGRQHDAESLVDGRQADDVDVLRHLAQEVDRGRLREGREGVVHAVLDGQLHVVGLNGVPSSGVLTEEQRVGEHFADVPMHELQQLIDLRFMA
jgi:hypothetical protein